MELRDLAESGVRVTVEPFFAAIEEPANHNNRGTLVYALEVMDCSLYFVCLFDLALQGNYEVSLHAYTIISEKAMDVTSLMVQEAEAKLASYTPPSHMSDEDSQFMKAELADILGRLRDRFSGTINLLWRQFRLHRNRYDWIHAVETPPCLPPMGKARL